MKCPVVQVIMLFKVGIVLCVFLYCGMFISENFGCSIDDMLLSICNMFYKAVVILVLCLCIIVDCFEALQVSVNLLSEILIYF